MNTYIRKLARQSTHSYSLNIPKEIINTLNWRKKQKIIIIFDEKKKNFVVKDWKK